MNNMSNISTTPEIRQSLQKILKGNASFLRLKEDTKIPKGKYAVGSRNRLKNVPKEGNFGIIPDGDVFILDIDCHDTGKMSVIDQVQFFSKLLDTDLNNTFSIVTPSGGRHYYLRFPNHVLMIAKKYRIPKASLRYFNNSFNVMLDENFNVVKDGVKNTNPLIMEDLDADIRTGLITGYVVAPTSVVDGIEYKVLNNTDNILEISKTALERLDAVVRHRDTERSEKKRAVLIEKAKIRGEQFQDVDQSIFVVDNTEDVFNTPSSAVITSLRLKLDERKKDFPDTRFHAQRAFVKAALHCCYSDYAIAKACSELGIDHDRHTTAKITFKQLYKDVIRITPIAKYHGSYCQKGKFLRKTQRDEDRQKKLAENKEEGSFDLNLYLETLKNKISNQALSQRTRENRLIDPRVLDVEKIAITIAGQDHSFIKAIYEDVVFNDRDKQDKVLSDQFWNAIKIVDYYIQPLLNVGAKYVMLGKNSIMEKLGMTDSQVTQALRILRSHEIILIERKQRTGVPALYAVNEKFINAQLTRSLKRTWGRSRKVNQDDLNKVIGKSGKPLQQEKILDHLPIYFDRFNSCFREVFSGKMIESDLDVEVSDEESKLSREKKSSHVSVIARRISLFFKDLEKLEKIKSPKKFVGMSAEEMIGRTGYRGSGASKHYLREERELLGLSIVEEFVIVEKTGEIVDAENIDDINTFAIDVSDDIDDFTAESSVMKDDFDIDDSLMAVESFSFDDVEDFLSSTKLHNELFSGLSGIIYEDYKLIEDRKLDKTMVLHKSS